MTICRSSNAVIRSYRYVAGISLHRYWNAVTSFVGGHYYCLLSCFPYLYSGSGTTSVGISRARDMAAKARRRARDASRQTRSRVS